MKNVTSILATVMLCVFALCPSVLGQAMSDADVKDHMLNGYKAVQAKDYEKAEALFANVVNHAVRCPRMPEAMMMLGSLQCRKDRTKGMNTYRMLAERYPEAKEAPIVLYRLGSENMLTKHLRDSQDAFLAAANSKNISKLDRGRALLQVGFVDMTKYFTSEFWDKAEDGSPVLVKSNEKADRVQYLESARKQFEETREAYTGTEQSGIAVVADAVLGEIYLISAKPELAEAAYRRALNENDSVSDKLDALAMYGLGQAYYGQNDLESALEQFEQAISKFSPGSIYGFGIGQKKSEGNMHNWKVLTLYGLRRFDDALIAAQEARAKFEKDPGLAKDYVPVMNLWEGLILCQTGKKSEGLEVLRGIASKHPGTSYAIRAGKVISQFEEGVK